MKKILVLMTVITLAVPIWATAPHPGDDYVLPDYYYNVPMIDTSINPLLMRFNYLYEFRQIADFCAFWQLDDADSADHGGMIEAETGELKDIIQTDNTQEAIWVWSRYGELTGDTSRYRENIDKAWFYCENFPAWEEEGDPGQDYYRAHNCAWGIAAESRFRNVYGDNSKGWYRDSCVSYIETHPLSLSSKLNRLVTGWCAGWLYYYTTEFRDGVALDSALAHSHRLLEKINEAPQFHLSDEYWAMSAGTMVWGISNSYFQENMSEGIDWVAENGHYLDTFQVWKPSGRSWDNSWNVGFCNGHGAMYDISGDEKYARHHKWLAHKLLSYDTDDDGGIPATTKDTDTTDMSWVSTYLCMMGLDRLIGEVPDFDAGVLELVDIYDGKQIEVGTVIDLKAVVSNFGLGDMSGVSVELEGLGSGSADLGFLEADTVVLVEGWEVPDSAVLRVTINHADDENDTNDTLTVRLNKAAGIGEDRPESIAGLDVGYASGGDIRISYSLKGAHGYKLSVYSADGRLVRSFDVLSETGSIIWDGRCKDGSQVSAGVYFFNLKTSDGAITRKTTLLE
ncbi:hypothetical protein GF359_05515 [candidate division WOR-3 bacterium]|uniref:FlgD Ig-like domain-containing protein n=1 Tax=candidate division WOR-3 bacterium TaxID=2052148 RepID=A0A9D5KAJ3_UNCW3|nr:hypothetical protein [candidate division WOR-3 bacterium]MBD3364654.1 hypothetical protein [candidate division WOR-3 bacterium]